MTTYIDRNGLQVPETAIPTETEEIPEMTTEPDVRPMRWTEDGQLETDPRGIPTVRQKPARSPLVWFKSRAADVSQQLNRIDNPKVSKAKAKLAESESLESVDNDPRSIARANRAAKKWATLALLGSIAAGLLISSATAQQTIAETLGWTSAGLGYWLAYLADPAIGVPLFAMLGVTSLATQRGVQLPDSAHRAFKRCEVALFVLVALLNGGPALASALRSLVVLFGASESTLRVMDTAGHGFMYAVIHLIGPVLVGTVIWALPHVSGALALISNGSQSTSHRRTETPAETGSHAPVHTGSHLHGQNREMATENPGENPLPDPAHYGSKERARDEYARLMATGEITGETATNAIAERLGVSWQTAKNIRNGR